MDIRIYVTDVLVWHFVKVKVGTDIVMYRLCMCVSAEVIFPVLRSLLSHGYQQQQQL